MMPAEDVTISLSGLPIVDIVKLGDWIKYPTNDLPAFTAGSGSFNPSTYSGGWRVVTKSGQTIQLMATASLGSTGKPSSQTHSELIGFLNIINQGFLNSTYASSVTYPTYSSGNVSNWKSLGIDTPATMTGTLVSGATLYVYLTNGSDNYAQSTWAYRPIVTLKSGLYLGGGSGTQADPYTLSLE